MKTAFVSLSVATAAADHQSTPDFQLKVQEAQEKARDMVEMFLYKHGAEQYLNEGAQYFNEGAEKFQELDEKYQIQRRYACSQEVARTTEKLSEYIMLATYGSPLSFSAGLTGVGEVVYKLPRELYDCFTTKSEYEEADSEWSQYLHKEETAEYLQKELNETIPQGWDLNWKHHIPKGYEEYADGAEKVAHEIYQRVHFTDKEAQGYWDVLKESMTLF